MSNFKLEKEMRKVLDKIWFRWRYYYWLKIKSWVGIEDW